MTGPVSDRDRELLSALLDGRLSAKDRESIEQRMAASTDLMEEWKQLQRLRTLMKSLPRHKSRRSFLLKPGSVPERKPSALLFPMRLAAGLASAGLVIVLALDALPLLGGFASRAAAPMAPAAVSESLSAEKAAAGQAASEIIMWSTPTVEAFGKGGGPPSESPGSANLAAPAVPAPAEPVAATPPAVIPTEPSLPAPSAADSLEGQSPILGIPPAEEQGRVIGEIREAGPEGTTQGLPLHPALELSLAAIALGCAAAVVLLGRKKSSS